MRYALVLCALLTLSGCAAFRRDATPEAREQAAGTVETVTTALGDALPWPWNQIVFGLGPGICSASVACVWR